MRYRIAVDTGGTFSDFIVFDEQLGTYRIIKVPSTPDDPGRAVLDGLAMLQADGVPADSIGVFCHGTTVATNALLEGRGVPGRPHRHARGSAASTRRWSRAARTARRSSTSPTRSHALLAPQSRTAEVAERIGATGEVRRALDEESVAARRSRQLEAEGVERSPSACCSPTSTRRTSSGCASSSREATRSGGPSPPVDLLPLIREYPRLSTTVINAYVSAGARPLRAAALGASSTRRASRRAGGSPCSATAAPCPSTAPREGRRHHPVRPGRRGDCEHRPGRRPRASRTSSPSTWAAPAATWR